MKHSTEHPEILGYIDIKHIQHKKATLSGWCLTKQLECKPLRFVHENTFFFPKVALRSDVCAVYNILNVKCGWEIEAPVPCKLQMEYNNEWVTVFSFTDPADIPIVSIGKSIASYIVVDHFYERPDEIRKFALNCEFKYHPNNHKGKRTDQCYRFDGLKERFEEIIGKKIINWEKYGTNGCFQYCVGGDQLVYHCDDQQYAGVLFLTPDAPVQTGTCLFRSKHTHKMKVPSEEHLVVFKKGYLDSTEFEKVDTIGNVYNRIVLFDSKVIHAATEYFGNSKENGRLFQLFFFDLE